ncbi:MAG: GNAT family N-acetyltransferase, partial [Candidatus Hodarchaeales archaeon]
MEFREATENDKKMLEKIWLYAFNPSENSYEVLKKKEDKNYPYKQRTFIVEENNNIRAVLSTIKFSQNIRGTFVKSAGVAGVACRPEYRRKGYITKLFSFAFKKMLEEEFLVSILYPFSYSFYEKFGYGQADSIKLYTIKSKDIIQRPTPNRIVQEDFDPDFRRCQPLYDRLTSQITGLVKRPPDVWRNLRGWNWNQKGFQFICQDSKGTDLGYLILRFEKKTFENPKSHIAVREMVFFDPQTKQALLNFLANHDSQREMIKIAPFDQNYLPFLVSPRMENNQELANSMFRIVDVEHLLPKLSYPLQVQSQIRIRILENPTLCHWNN